MKPQRITLLRKKGFRLQEVSLALNGLPAVRVCRPGQWGNPFKPQVGHDVQWCVDKYRNWLRERICPNSPMTMADRARKELCGWNLACWCKLFLCDKCGAEHDYGPEGSRCISNLSQPGHGHFRCTGHFRRVPCHADVLLEIANS